MNEKVLLFDFDGTIADSLSFIVSIYNELAETFHLPRKVNKEEIPKLRQLHLHELLKELHIPSWKIPFLLYVGRRKFSKQITSLSPIAGIEQVLPQLKEQGFMLGIVTSNTTAAVAKFLEANNMEFFNFIHSEKGLFGKDKILKSVMKKYKLSPGGTLYIGDEIRDIEAARKAGIKIVSVSWGANTKSALLKAQPDYLIEKPSDLMHISNA